MIIQVSCLQRGRPLCRCQPQIEYSYEMPIGRNGYSVKIPDGLAVTGYSGTLLLDPEAFDLAWLVVRTDEVASCQFSLSGYERGHLQATLHPPPQASLIRPPARYNLRLGIEIHAVFAQRVQIAKE